MAGLNRVTFAEPSCKELGCKGSAQERRQHAKQALIGVFGGCSGMLRRMHGVRGATGGQAIGEVTPTLILFEQLLLGVPKR